MNFNCFGHSITIHPRTHTGTHDHTHMPTMRLNKQDPRDRNLDAHAVAVRATEVVERERRVPFLTLITARPHTFSYNNNNEITNARRRTESTI